MSKVTKTFILTFSILLIHLTGLLGQSTAGPFTFYPNPSSGVFQGQATIDGIPAEAGDVIAAFDEAGNCAGADTVIINAGIAYINLPIYGDDNTTTELDEGINAGENFILKLWDSSENVILDYSGVFDCWYNNNGAPMNNCGDISEIYDFPGQTGPEDHAPEVGDIPDQTITDGQTFTSFDLDDYLTELDGDNVEWSYTIGEQTPDNFSAVVNVAGGTSAYDLTFGFSPDATDGYDSGFDQYAPPAPPPPSFDAALKWDGDRYYTQILAGDGDHSEHSLDIQLQYAEDNLINMTWNNTGWSSLATFILQDAFGGAMINLDMTNPDPAGVSAIAGSLDITDPANPILTLTNNAFNLLKLKVTPADSRDAERSITVDIDADNVVTVNYDEGWIGSETVVFIATDQTEAGLSDSDDATFTVEEAPTEPSIEITSPTEGEELFSSDIAIDFIVNNFTIGGPGSGEWDGHIHYRVDGAAYVMHYTDDPIQLTGLSEGSHTVNLELVDNSHQSLDPVVSDEVNFTITIVVNNPPVADAGLDQTVDEGELVTLDGSGSSDPDGDVITYLWSAPGGINLSDPTAANPTFTAPEVDENTGFTFTLTVNDGEFDSGPDYVIITVLDVLDAGPTAGFTWIADSLEVTFTDASAAGETPITNWSWDFGDGNTATDQNPVHTYNEAGTYTVSLTVTDENGLTDIAEETIAVGAPPEGTTIGPFTFFPNPASGVFQGQATIDGVPAEEGDVIAAFDEDGNCAGAQELTIWSGDAYINLPIYGDDPTTSDQDEGINTGENFFLKLWDSSENVIITYPDAFSGWFNNNGAPIPPYDDPYSVYDFAVIVENICPIANAGTNQIVVEGDQVTLHGSGSYDLNGDSLSFLWSAPDNITLSDETDPEPTFTAPDIEGDTDYLFTLTVNDGICDSDPDSVVVTVIPLNNPPVADNLTVETNEDTAVEIILSGTDPDGDEISFEFGEPEHGIFDGTTYTPMADYFGTDSFSYVAFDGVLYSEEAIVSITILPVNDPPVVDAGEDRTVFEGETVNLVGGVDDIDSEIASVLWSSSDSAIVFENPNYLATSFIAPDVDEITDYTITLTVTDTDGGSGSDTMIVTVIMVGDNAPIVGDIPDQTVIVGFDFESFDLDDYLTELDGDSIEWSYELAGEQPSGFAVSINVAGGLSDYDLTFGFSSDATDGYDDGIDQYAPPAPPPPSFDAALGWDGERYYTQILADDGDYSEHVLDVQLQYDTDNLISITWDNTGWADLGTFILQDAFDGMLGINVDMTTENSLTLDNPAFNTLKIKVTPTAPANTRDLTINIDEDNIVTITYDEGWIGSAEVIFTATDQSEAGLSDSDIATYTVREDHAPVVEGIEDQTINAGATFSPFDLDDYLTELDNDEIGWSYEILGAPPTGFTASVNVSGGGAEYDLTFGFSSDATDGYDPDFDQYAPPAPPPPAFDAALGWLGDRYYIQILADDGDYSEHIWDIQLQYPEDGVITITWDNTGWTNLGTFVLQDAFGGAMINVDMVAENSLTLDNPAFNLLKLMVTPATPSGTRGLMVDIDENNVVTIGYDTGWTGTENITFIATDQTEAGLFDSDTASFTVGVLGVSGEMSLAEEFTLHQNYPNPFNPTTTIIYDIPVATEIRIDIFNLLGKKVRSLVNGYHEPGHYRIIWDATDESGLPLPSGVYMYRISSKNFASVKKLILMK